MNEFAKDIENIYSHIQNDYSREIFSNRLLYSLTNDKRYIHTVISMTPEGREFLEKLHNGKRNLIFGAGTWGKEILTTYSDVHFECFVDNKVKSTHYAGLPVISFAEYINQYKDDTIVIATRLYHKEIYTQLKANGIDDSHIINAGKMIDDMSKRQYFDLPELKAKQLDTEIFVDAGSFDGATSLLFMDWCGSREGKVWAFEPEAKNADLCETNLRNYFVQENERRGGVQNCALWAMEQDGRIAFSVRCKWGIEGVG